MEIIDTQKLYCRDEKETRESLVMAAKIIKSGGLVAFPTETVYGLGANALDENAVKKIYAAKGRPSDNPMIVHVSGREGVDRVCAEVPPKAEKIMDRFWPGPISVILPKKAGVPDATTGGLATVAVRCPENRIARELIHLSGVPVAAPSANLSGKPSPTRAGDVWDDLQGRIDAVLFSGPCEVGVESTIIDLSKDPPVLYRPGKITPGQIEDAIGRIIVSDAVLGELPEGERALSPGMKYVHYAPKAEVILLKGDLDRCAGYVNASGGDAGVICFAGEEGRFSSPHVVAFGERDDPDEGARRLFSLLRDFDKKGVKKIFVRYPDENGVGLAVANRLLRAAGYRTMTF